MAYLPVTSVLCLCREDRDPRYPQSLLTISRNLPSWLSISHRCHRYIRMSQWSSPCLSTNSWYYWSPWYSTQTLPSTIPIIIHVISIFVQLLSDEKFSSDKSCTKMEMTWIINYNYGKCYFIFTKLQSSEVFREIPTLSPRLSPAKLKDKHAVFISCRLKMEGFRLHRQQLLSLFDFYFVVIMSKFRTETSEESCICEISINLYFCTCLFNFFWYYKL